MKRYLPKTWKRSCGQACPRKNHDALCEKLGVDPSMQAVAVLLIGKADSSVDATSGATTREAFETKTSIIN